MAFDLKYGGDGPLARQRWHLEWIDWFLTDRAKALGWDGLEPLHFVDRDGYMMGGFVPAAWRPS